MKNRTGFVATALAISLMLFLSGCTTGDIEHAQLIAEETEPSRVVAPAITVEQEKLCTNYTNGTVAFPLIYGYSMGVEGGQGQWWTVAYEKNSSVEWVNLTLTWETDSPLDTKITLQRGGSEVVGGESPLLYRMTNPSDGEDRFGILPYTDYGIVLDSQLVIHLLAEIVSICPSEKA